jgi:hypothetical protein
MVLIGPVQKIAVENQSVTRFHFNAGGAYVATLFVAMYAPLEGYDLQSKGHRVYELFEPCRSCPPAAAP